MVQFIPAKDDWADAFRQIGAGLAKGYTNRADENAVQKSIADLGDKPTPRQILDAITSVKTYTPEAKQQALQNYLGVEQFEELKRHAKAQEAIQSEKNRVASLGKMTPEERAKSFQNFKSRGYDDAEAEAMTSPYVPDGTKQAISRVVEDEIARRLRQPKKPQETAQEQVKDKGISTTIGADQNSAVGQENAVPVDLAEVPVVEPREKTAKESGLTNASEWPEILPPPNMKPSELVKWRDRNQGFNNKELKEIKGRTASNLDAILHYSRLQQLNDTGKVQDGLSRVLIDPDTGEPYKNVQKLAGVNKETQQYIKTLNDFISQAKNFFGARVTNFDLQSFKSRLPSLINTEEGRRAILEQMRLMTELQSVHDTAMVDGFKHYGNRASYSDIVKVVDEKVNEKEKNIINKINKLDTATKWLDRMATNPKYKDMELMYMPETNEFVAVRPKDIEGAKKKGYELWRTPL